MPLACPQGAHPLPIASTPAPCRVPALGNEGAAARHQLSHCCHMLAWPGWLPYRCLQWQTTCS